VAVADSVVVADKVAVVRAEEADGVAAAEVKAGNRFPGRLVLKNAPGLF
jgi:hypothetical protein